MVAIIIVLEGLIGATAAAILCVLQATGAIDVGWGWAVSPFPLSMALEIATVFAAWIQISLLERKS